MKNKPFTIKVKLPPLDVPTKLSSEGGERTLVNLHFLQTVTQQMGGSMDWQAVTRAMMDCRMQRGD